MATTDPSDSTEPPDGGKARRRRLHRVIFAVVAALILAGVGGLAATSGSSSAGYDTNPSAFVLPRLGKSGVVKLATFVGKPLVVNFFASWCTVCAKELPVFAADARALRGKVSIIEVNALETGNGEAFAKRFGLYTSVAAVARDVGGSQGDGLYQSFGGMGAMPLTEFYGSNGQAIIGYNRGFTAKQLAAELHTLYGITAPQ